MNLIMPKRNLVAALACMPLVSCTLDSLTIFRHPGHAPKGATFEMQAGNLISIFSTVSVEVTDEDVVRDSIHFAVGLPQGWQVVSAKAYVAEHFRPLKPGVVTGGDTLQAYLDSAAAFEGRAMLLTAAPAMENFFRGRTFTVYPSPDTTLPVLDLEGDSVPQWIGFSGRINVSVPAGTPVDTIMEFDPQSQGTTLPWGMLQSARLKTAQRGGPEFLGVVGIPVFLYAQVRAGNADVNANIFYYSKTGPLPPSDPDSLVLDEGEMVYHPIAVGSASLRKGTQPFRRLAVENTSSQYRIRIPGRGGRLVLRDAGGRAIRAWTGGELAAGLLAWDGRGRDGNKVERGRYFLTWTEGRRTASAVIAVP